MLDKSHHDKPPSGAMKQVSWRPRWPWEWIGIFLGVWGIPGMIDDGGSWARWVDSMEPYGDAAPFILSMGITLFMWSRLQVWHRLRTRPSAPQEAQRQPVGSGDSPPEITIDLKEQIDAIEAARRCAGETNVDHPRVRAWLDRLTASQTFLLDPIDAATVLTIDQWLTIVHNICHLRGDPLPSFFQRALDNTPTDPKDVITDMEAFRSAPGSGVLAIKLIRAARTVEEADRVFEMHRHADTRTDVVDVYKAYGGALSQHGEQVRADEIWHKAGFIEAGGKED